MTIFRIYIIGVIAGLVYPVIDDLLYTYSQTYRETGSVELNESVKAYRMGPFHYKLIAAFIPVINLIWVVTLILLVRLYIISYTIDLKIAIVKKLAKNPKKGFLLRHWIVKHLFPRYLDFFHRRVEMSFLENENDIATVKAIFRILEMISKLDSVELKKKDDEQQKDRE